jgi:hypothetical protein
MALRQGVPLTEEEITKIKLLLAKTDMTITEIAQRAGRSRSVVNSINKKFKIRQYGGRKRNWTVGSDDPCTPDRVAASFPSSSWALDCLGIYASVGLPLSGVNWDSGCL